MRAGKPLRDYLLGRFTRGPHNAICAYANVGESAFDCDGKRYDPAPSGPFARNPFGLYDMIRQTSQEWTADCWKTTPTTGPPARRTRLAYRGIAPCASTRGRSFLLEGTRYSSYFRFRRPQYGPGLGARNYIGIPGGAGDDGGTDFSSPLE